MFLAAMKCSAFVFYTAYLVIYLELNGTFLSCAEIVSDGRESMFEPKLKTRIWYAEFQCKQSRLEEISATLYSHSLTLGSSI